MSSTTQALRVVEASVTLVHYAGRIPLFSARLAQESAAVEGLHAPSERLISATIFLRIDGTE